MRRMKKRISGMLVLCMLFLMAFSGTVMAAGKKGTWKHDKRGWWYSYSDGTYAKNEWVLYGGKWYYFLNSGYMETNGYRDGYWISKSGAANLKYSGGRWKKDANGWWYTDKTKWYPKNEWLQVDGKWYYFNARGYVVMNEWIDGYCLGADGAWVKNASTAWAKAYISYMDQHYKDKTEYTTNFENLSFDLLYVDDDSTPELLVRHDDSGLETDIVTYYGGKCKAFEGLGKDGSVQFIPHSALVYNSYGRQGVYHDVISKLDKGMLRVIGDGSKVAKDIYMDEYEYEWNGKSMDEGEYESRIMELFDSTKSQDSDYQSYFAYEDMIAALSEYK